MESVFVVWDEYAGPNSAYSSRDIADRKVKLRGGLIQELTVNSDSEILSTNVLPYSVRFYAGGIRVQREAEFAEGVGHSEIQGEKSVTVSVIATDEFDAAERGIEVYKSLES